MKGLERRKKGLYVVSQVAEHKRRRRMCLPVDWFGLG